MGSRRDVVERLIAHLTPSLTFVVLVALLSPVDNRDQLY
jgi:hypothetical protein